MVHKVTKRSIKLLQWNSCSIKSKINELSKHAEDFDIIIILETWFIFRDSIYIREFDGRSPP